MAPWANFGLAGMVIGALFITLWAVGRSILLKILEMHQAERKEWRDTFQAVCAQFDARHQESNEVARKLTEAIAKLSNPKTAPKDP